MGSEMDETLPFGQQVKRLRKELDLTQEALAEQVGCAVVTLKKIEQGTLRPSHQLATLLAGALHVDRAAQPAFLHRAELTGRPAGGPPAPQSNLPLPATPLIGRAGEIAAVTALLCRADVRLVTLTGPPGVGKTRLALQITAELRADFADGVCFVALAALRDPDLVLPAIAQALGLRERGSLPTAEFLRRHLRDKHLLLVLDNFEQVAPAAGEISNLLGGSADLKVLVTSRAPLHLAAEHEYPVPPLAVPDLAHLPAPDALAQIPAVALFLARAEASGVPLTLDPATARDVAAICRCLDGIPLALELAAPRLKVLPLAALLARLERRLPLLTGGAIDLPVRQQTLRSTIAWSYDLLGEVERTLFRRLAVFQGGAGLDAVAAICNARGDLGMDVLDGLTTLVDQSLLRTRAGAAGEARYGMLELIHEYAWERLEESGEAAGQRLAHARYFLALAEEAEPQLVGREQGRWLARLEDDLDNIRAVLAWAQQEAAQSTEGAREAAATGLRLAGALARFWEIHCHIAEGRAHLAAALARGEATTPGRARALGAAARLARTQGDLGAGEMFCAEALALYRAQGDRAGIATALNERGNIASELALNELGSSAGEQKNAVAARAYFEESLALWRAIGDRAGIAGALMNLGLEADLQDDYPEARALLEEGLALYRELGDSWVVASAQYNLGFVARREGDYGRAAALLTESLQGHRALGDLRGAAMCLAQLGLVSYLKGDYAAAHTLFEECQAADREAGSPAGDVGPIWLGLLALAQGKYQEARMRLLELLTGGYDCYQAVVASALTGLAEVVLVSGPPVAQATAARAVRVLGAVAPYVATSNDTQLPPAGHSYERSMAAARQALGEERFAAEWAAGQALTLEQAEAEIRAVL